MPAPGPAPAAKTPGTTADPAPVKSAEPPDPDTKATSSDGAGTSKPAGATTESADEATPPAKAPEQSVQGATKPDHSAAGPAEGAAKATHAAAEPAEGAARPTDDRPDPAPSEAHHIAEQRVVDDRPSTSPSEPTPRTGRPQPPAKEAKQRPVPSARLSGYQAEAAKLLAGAMPSRRKRRAETDKPSADPVAEDQAGKTSRPAKKGQPRPSGKG